jgi:hypothetical protein
MFKTHILDFKGQCYKLCLGHILLYVSQALPSMDRGRMAIDLLLIIDANYRLSVSRPYQTKAWKLLI